MGGQTSLHTTVKQTGFRFQKVSIGRAMLMERNYIMAARNKHLREIKRNRESSNPRPEIYLDETWVNQNEFVNRCRKVVDGSTEPKLKTEKGARFIIGHAGGQQGFIPGALMMFK